MQPRGSDCGQMKHPKRRFFPHFIAFAGISRGPRLGVESCGLLVASLKAVEIGIVPISDRRGWAERLIERQKYTAHPAMAVRGVYHSTGTRKPRWAEQNQRKDDPKASAQSDGFFWRLCVHSHETPSRRNCLYHTSAYITRPKIRKKVENPRTA